MAEQLNDMPGRSSFGNCTSLRQPLAVHVGSDHELQFLRGGGCTSLRLGDERGRRILDASQFLRELHFIEAWWRIGCRSMACTSQFLRELHFIEAPPRRTW